VIVVTIRSGTRTVRVDASDAAAAHSVVQAECRTSQCHCPPEWCTDDIQSDVINVRGVTVPLRCANTGKHRCAAWASMTEATVDPARSGLHPKTGVSCAASPAAFQAEGLGRVSSPILFVGERRSPRAMAIVIWNTGHRTRMRWALIRRVR
jgi:hypothetical protein